MPKDAGIQDAEWRPAYTLFENVRLSMDSFTLKRINGRSAQHKIVRDEFDSQPSVAVIARKYVFDCKPSHPCSRRNHIVNEACQNIAMLQMYDVTARHVLELAQLTNCSQGLFC